MAMHVKRSEIAMSEAEHVNPAALDDRASTCHFVQADERVVAALMYGSFTRGEGDEHSDIEFAFFFEDDVLPQLDQRTWVAQIAPVLAYFLDAHGAPHGPFRRFGTGGVPLQTGVSHRLGSRSGAATPGFPSLEAAVLVDRSGALSQVLASLVGPRA